MIVGFFNRRLKKCVETHFLTCGVTLLVISPPVFSGIFQSNFPVDAQTINPSIHTSFTKDKVVAQDSFPIGPQSINPLGKNTSMRNKEVSVWKKMLSSISSAELPALVDKVQATQSSVELSGITVRPSYKYQSNTDTESWSALIVEKQEEVIQVTQNNIQDDPPALINVAGERRREDNTDLSSARHFTPSISLKTGWDDNLFREKSNMISSWFTVLSPSIKYETGIGAHNFSALYAANIGHYFSSKKDDYLDQTVKLDAFLDLAIRHRVMLGAEYKDGHDPRGTDDPVLDIGGGVFVAQDPDEWNSRTADGTYSFGAKGSQGRIDLYGGHILRRYSNNHQDIRDRDITNYSVVLNTRWAKINFLAGTELSNIDYINENPATVLASGSLDSQESSVFAGATWVATGKTSGTVKIGSLSKSFDSSLREDLSGSGWEIDLVWQPVSYSKWGFGTYRDAREQTTGNDDYVVTQNYKVSWWHKWLNQYESRIVLGLGESKFNKTNRTDDSLMFSSSIEKSFNRTFKGGLSYQYLERDSTDNASDYERNLIMLTITSDF